MFAFFVSGEFKGFWVNRAGDKFADATIKAMGWPKASTTLVRFDGLKSEELQGAEASLEEVRVYRSEEQEVGFDEETQAPITESVKVLVRTIPADMFINNGLMVRPC